MPNITYWIKKSIGCIRDERIRNADDLDISDVEDLEANLSWCVLNHNEERDKLKLDSNVEGNVDQTVPIENDDTEVQNGSEVCDIQPFEKDVQPIGKDVDAQLDNNPYDEDGGRKLFFSLEQTKSDNVLNDSTGEKPHNEVKDPTGKEQDTKPLIEIEDYSGTKLMSLLLDAICVIDNRISSHLIPLIIHSISSKPGNILSCNLQ